MSCDPPPPTEAWRDDPAEYDRLKAELEGMNPHDAAVIRHDHHEGNIA